MDNPFKSPTILSLCTGMRGLERGIERAIGAINTVAYVEIEAFIIWNLVKTMEQGVLAPAPVWSNLKTFPWAEFHGKVHGIIGGYPCQPFSVAGLGKGEGDPRHLWPFIKEGIRAIKPVWCFFENVANHLNIGYEVVRRELQGMGYKVEEGIYSAEEVGAPHRRERLFILAILGNSDCKSDRNYEQGIYPETSSAGAKLGHTTQSDEQRNGLCEICRQRQAGRYGNEELADSNNQGPQRRNSGKLQKCSRECTARTSSAFSWPAKPGQQQHDWEEPRVKSRLGTTINGYNFREDLLRMAGNGVVEQTAEIAFIDLFRKHGIT